MVSELGTELKILMKRGAQACADNDLQTATQSFNSALSVAREQGADHETIGEIYFKLGWCNHALGYHSVSEKMYRGALSAFEHSAPSMSSQVLKQMSDLYKDMGRQRDSEEALARAAALTPAIFNGAGEAATTYLEVNNRPHLNSEATGNLPFVGADRIEVKPFSPSQLGSDALGGESTLRIREGAHSSSANESSLYRDGAKPYLQDDATHPSDPELLIQTLKEAASPREVSERPRKTNANRQSSPPVLHGSKIEATREKKVPRSSVYMEPEAQAPDLQYEALVAARQVLDPDDYIDASQYVHPREKLWGTISATIGVMVYFFSLIFIIGLVILPCAFVMGFISSGLHLGALRSYGIRVSERQFPEVHRLVEEYCTILKMEVPEVLVINGDGLLNAFAARLHRKNVVTICSDVLEMAYEQGEKELAFVVVHELSHVKLGHTKFNWLHIPGAMVPFLGNAYSRACEYSCDRIARRLVPDGALFGLVSLASGTKLYRRVNLQALYDQADTDWGFWTWFHEIQSTHPNLVNRIRAIGIADGEASGRFQKHTSRR